MLGTLIILACSETSIVDSQVDLPPERVIVRDGHLNFAPSWHPFEDRFVYLSRPITAQTPIEGGSSSPISGFGAYTKGLVIKEIEKGSTVSRELVFDSTGVNFVSYSPDGASLLFCSCRNGSADVYSLHIESGRLQRRSQEIGDESHPCWSPSGDRFAYISNGILVISGDSPIYYTDLPVTISAICWADDGESLLMFASIKGEQSLYRFSPAMEQLTQIGATPFDGLYLDFAEPIFSDGADIGPQLVYQKKNSLFVFSFSQQRSSLVIENGNMPCFSPDGSQVVYSNQGEIIVASIWIGVDD